MKDMLYAVLALIFLAVAGFSFYEYVTTPGDIKLYLAGAIVSVLLAVVLGGLFLSGRVNKNDDIHITE